MILFAGASAGPDVSNETKAGKSRLKSLMVLMVMGAAAYYLEWEWAVGTLLALYWAWRSTGWKGKALTLIAAPAVMTASVFPIEAVGEVVVHVAKGWANASGHPKGREKPHGWTDPSAQKMGRYYEDFLVNSGPLKGLGCERQHKFEAPRRLEEAYTVEQSWSGPGEVRARRANLGLSSAGGRRFADFLCRGRKAARRLGVRHTKAGILVEAKCLFPYGQVHGGNEEWAIGQGLQISDYAAYCREVGCEVAVVHCGPEPPWYRLLRERAGVTQVRENYGNWRHELRLEAMMRVQAFAWLMSKLVDRGVFERMDGA